MAEFVFHGSVYGSVLWQCLLLYFSLFGVLFYFVGLDHGCGRYVWEVHIL